MPTSEESVVMAMLKRIAQVLSRHPPFRANPLTVKGGTALALGYGLTRPSIDLDITCRAKPNKERILDVAANAVRQTGAALTRADIKQRGHGHIRLQWERHDAKRMNPTTSGVTVDVKGNDSLAMQENTMIRDGFRTFKLPTLVKAKLETLIGATPRSRARDLYDAAWILENHMDAVVPTDRIALYERVNGEVVENAKEWEADFLFDDIMSRASFHAVWDSLNESLDHDPVVRFHQDPSGSLEVKNHGDALLLTFSGRATGEVTIGTFSDQGALRQWLGTIDPHGTLPAPPLPSQAMDHGGPAGS